MRKSEQETSVNYEGDSEEVRIFSCIRKDITALKKSGKFTLVDEGKYVDGSIWAEFTIPVENFSVARGAKSQRKLTDEQRQALADRLANARKKATDE